CIWVLRDSALKPLLSPPPKSFTFCIYKFWFALCLVCWLLPEAVAARGHREREGPGRQAGRDSAEGA
ncbi:MAG: hypothetical protein IKT11_07270, partial [Bacteroidales bacterium]|nr:hypothetical protein [Bacteroidales bacterium]